MKPIQRGLLILLTVCLMVGVRAASPVATHEAVIDAEALKADIWIVPPRTPRETEAAVEALRRQYAPFLRSLPAPIETRQRQYLAGPWRSKFEVSGAADGKRPTPPDWFRGEHDDSAWETAPVPEWRWLPIRKGDPHKIGREGSRWYPASCILWYRTSFKSAPAPVGQRVFLCFAGVDWEAEVWLNGEFLGRHVTYYEPFHFDVTRLLRAQNSLVVRVISGPLYGEPMSHWSLFPFVPADAGENQRYVMGDHARSFPGYQFGTIASLGNGFGIHREVYLETTGEACVSGIFARCNPPDNQARVTVETDAVTTRDLDLEVQILPENFEGRAYRHADHARLAQGAGKCQLTLAMPEAKTWWPAEPYLYRCRAILRDGERVVDARDILFGRRSFAIVSPSTPRPGLTEGTFLLNGRPVFLRGTNLSGALNAYWYWGEQENLLKAALMVKAANFNAVRSTQHVGFPEVRELYDRLGIMSEQDQGAGYEFAADVSGTLETLARTGTTLARTCYNNPGVVLLSFANETTLDVASAVGNALAVDPERILVPVSGGWFGRIADRQAFDHLIADIHYYDAWYTGVHMIWESARTRPASQRTPGRLMTVGEYGAEALDAYETMLHYPRHWGPTPAPSERRLWGSRQVSTGANPRQKFGFRGRTAMNLGEYIEASQNYQADVLAEATKSFRISKATIGGYFQLHFLDGTAANWPKAIVSHDFRPKKGYYEMAQVNQPVVPLYRIADEGRAMEIWVANDLATTLTACKMIWDIRAGSDRLSGEARADVPASSAVLCHTVDLNELPAKSQVLEVALMLADKGGRTLSLYEREVYLSLKEVEESRRQAEAATRK
ncbi:MAG: hypothetical protein M1457_10955 [bacterium]|nr:hypothetical protein [bacterium]